MSACRHSTFSTRKIPHNLRSAKKSRPGAAGADAAAAADAVAADAAGDGAAAAAAAEAAQAAAGPGVIAGIVRPNSEVTSTGADDRGRVLLDPAHLSYLRRHR